ncbi:MAG: hypothetical protein K2O14_01735, partial [Oscillospiraceae bacterium]|nr:hypothetical protein [Oscillospiraceae bacterium]
YRTAFFRGNLELMITLALVLTTFILAAARISMGYGVKYMGFLGFASLAAFVIFFRGRKLAFQTSKERFTALLGKSSDSFYYSEITSVGSRERSFFGIRRGFDVTISSKLKTRTYRIICPKDVSFESTIFAEIEPNIRINKKSGEK